MANIPVAQKRELAGSLALLFKRWGKVADRRPYPDDDDEGGGVGGLSLPEHPFLQDLPVGVVPPDLAADVNQYVDVEVELEKRANEANPQLQKQPVVQAALGKGRGAPTPSTTI